MIEISTDEKLEVVERFIEQWRVARESNEGGERHIYLVLKAIADDLRAPTKADATAQAIERAIRNAKTRKAELQTRHYQEGNLREIAELVIGRWPTIKQALERTHDVG